MHRPQTVDQPADPHSHSRPDQIAVRHLSLDLTVDFDERRLSGTAALELDRRSPDATTLVLDTWSWRSSPASCSRIPPRTRLLPTS